ncbi:MAG: hypothetical protein GEU28_14565 [Dehalococcoidia bacterium]|nr:hypothetical protein [Dehalococcoidia bacterium]
MEPGSKNIVICSDGTGNTTVKGRGTNVFKLFESVDVNRHRTDARLPQQLAFYDDGVGTEALKWVRIFGGATGWGLSRNVRQLYRELCRVYEPGDAIFLFGFSRGAFTVRTLAGLINDCGLVDPRAHATEDSFRAQTRAAYAAYRCKYRAWLTRAAWRGGINADEFKRTIARPDVPPVPIRLLGVWDTVDAVGLPFRLADAWNKVVWQYKFETSTLGAVVARGCHALALDDERGAFGPVLWDERDPSTRARVEQVWFAGAHSNVGGGYPQQGMSLVALDWMMTQAEAAGLRFVAHTRDQYATAHSFADKLYDPRSGLGIFYRWQPRDVKALCERKGIAHPQVHMSAIERLVQAPEGYAPGNIPARIRVTTTEGHPRVRLEEIERCIADAHGGDEAEPLIRRKHRWVFVGFVAYVTFIAAAVAALLRVLAVIIVPPGDGLRPFLESLGRVVDPFEIAGTLWRDRVAFWLLVSGLAIGYVLSWWSDRQTGRFFSGFWHRHRPALREALRRTPAPDMDLRT